METSESRVTVEERRERAARTTIMFAFYLFIMFLIGLIYFNFARPSTLLFVSPRDIYVSSKSPEVTVRLGEAGGDSWVVTATYEDGSGIVRDEILATVAPRSMMLSLVRVGDWSVGELVEPVAIDVLSTPPRVRRGGVEAVLPEFTAEVELVPQEDGVVLFFGDFPSRLPYGSTYAIEFQLEYQSNGVVENAMLRTNFEGEIYEFEPPYIVPRDTDWPNVYTNMEAVPLFEFQVDGGYESDLEVSLVSDDGVFSIAREDEDSEPRTWSLILKDSERLEDWCSNFESVACSIEFLVTDGVTSTESTIYLGFFSGSEGDPAEGDPAEGDPAEGDPAEGDPAEGDPAEGDPAEGDPAEGDPAEGDPAEGDPAEGDPAEGDPAEGDPAEGDPAEGDPAEGDPAEGDPAEGDPAEGDTAEGDPAEGDTAEANTPEGDALATSVGEKEETELVRRVFLMGDDVTYWSRGESNKIYFNGKSGIALDYYFDSLGDDFTCDGRGFVLGGVASAEGALDRNIDLIRDRIDSLHRQILHRIEGEIAECEYLYVYAWRVGVHNEINNAAFRQQRPVLMWTIDGAGVGGDVLTGDIINLLRESADNVGVNLFNYHEQAPCAFRLGVDESYANHNLECGKR